MTLETGVKALAEAVGADVKALDTGKVNSNDPRLTDAREWSATTVTQAEAEAGTASTRRAWTAQRVRQAINAWWQLVTSGFGRNFISASNEQTARNVLQLTYPATAQTVGDGDAVLREGAGGWLGRGGASANPLGYPASVADITNLTKTIRSEAVDNGVIAYSSGIHFSASDTWGRLRVAYSVSRAWIQGGNASSGAGWTAELYHSANMLNIGKTAASARTALGLGYAATAPTVGAGAAVLREGAYGLGEQSLAGRAATSLGWNAFFNMNLVAINSSGPFMSYLGISQNTANIINDDGNNLILNAELFHTNNQLTLGKTPESARAALGLGYAATAQTVGTGVDVMRAGAFGFGGAGIKPNGADANNFPSASTVITLSSIDNNTPYPLSVNGAGVGISLARDTTYPDLFQMLGIYNKNQMFIRTRLRDGDFLPWVEVYHTGNTTKNPDGTLKASSPVINLYTDHHDTHNEDQFGATPIVTRKSKGVYEITGTLGLRSEGWYLDTPSDRNGNKYFNIEWTQNITPTAVDGIVDEYRDDIVVTIETFERVWNKETGMFDNGAPIDINELQDRFVQLRFNEIKVEHLTKQEAQ